MSSRFEAAASSAMAARVSGYFSSMFGEIVARRRRMRQSFGDRGQALSEFLLMSGLLIGSAGLFLKPWMLAAAPWGLAVPAVFLAGFLLIEARRQKTPAPAPKEEGGALGYDWIVLIWSLGCATAGAAAFFIALGAEPPPPPEPPAWQPPDEVMEFDLNENPPPPPINE
jgi:hypothetical protein